MCEITIFVKKGKMLRLYEYMSYCCYLAEGYWYSKLQGAIPLSFILIFLGVIELFQGVGVYEGFKLSNVQFWVISVFIFVICEISAFSKKYQEKIKKRYSEKQIITNPRLKIVVIFCSSLAFFLLAMFFEGRSFLFESIPPIDLLNEHAIEDFFISLF